MSVLDAVPTIRGSASNLRPYLSSADNPDRFVRQFDVRLTVFYIADASGPWVGSNVRAQQRVQVRTSCSKLVRRPHATL